MYGSMQKSSSSAHSSQPARISNRLGAWCRVSCAAAGRAPPSVAVHRSPPPARSPMAVPAAATRRLLAPARSRRAFWSASWSADQSAPSASSPPQDMDSKKKKAPSGSGPHRLAAVMDAVNDRKLPPELRGRGNAVRSETDIVNVVEQRIWHSMEEGHFENLPGKGKPLNLSSNPHADPAEDTLYRILSRNGCAPEWVELNKEIRGMIAGWRSALKKAWGNQSEVDSSSWNDDCRVLQEQIRQINDKVLLGTSSHIYFP
ncbi:hypothetical protein PVAP13_6KG412400 [Panicum virgatum]|uniref:DnaJ homologue subfamily C member 28 conserved domain-containing protein n=1 Tax=Panicum virgatum TaxID=38727 RepID=A0A8T0RLF1_PANVG|nr:hypothetical protein PVAP13_6KG412400 [Panicum virgatum]